MNSPKNAYGSPLMVFCKLRLMKSSFTGIHIILDHPGMKPQVECLLYCLQSQRSLEDLIAVSRYPMRSCKKFKLNAFEENK